MFVLTACGNKRRIKILIFFIIEDCHKMKGIKIQNIEPSSTTEYPTTAY